MYQHSIRYMNENSSKRVFGGQRTKSFFERMYFFAYVSIFIMLTFGIGYFIILKMKKSQFHPDVFAEGTSNAIDTSKVQSLVGEAGYTLEEGETPKILLNIKRKEFMLFTDRSIYYSLTASSKITDVRIVHGKLPLANGSKILTKPRMSDVLDIMVGDEIIGVISDGNDQRIIVLLNSIAKDIREGNQ